MEQTCDCEEGWCLGDDCPHEECWRGTTTSDSHCPARKWAEFSSSMRKVL